MSKYAVVEALSPQEVENYLEAVKSLTLHLIVKGNWESQEVVVQPIFKNTDLPYSYEVLARKKYDMEDRTLDGTLKLEFVSEKDGYKTTLELLE